LIIVEVINFLYDLAYSLLRAPQNAPQNVLIHA